MAITLDGSTGVTAAEFDGTVDASNLTGVLPAIDGSALTGIDTAPPTTFDAVGTYAHGRPANTTNYSLGATVSGLYATADIIGSYGGTAFYNTSFQQTASTQALSGTWRHMGGAGGAYVGGVGSHGMSGLWVRIS